METPKKVSAGKGRAVVGTVLATALVALVIGSILRVPDQALIELLRLAFSWPTVAALLGSIVLLNFHEQIGNYIERVGNIEATAAGVRFTESQRQQPAMTPAGSQLQSESAPLSSDQERELANVREQFDQLQTDLTANRYAASAWAQAAQDISGRLQQKEMEANFWRFLYMSVYFAPVTHAVLRWIAAHTGRTPKDYYHAVWARAVPSQLEREAILNALIQTQAVEDMGDAIDVTELGSRYLLFLSGLPGPGNWTFTRPEWPPPPPRHASTTLDQDAPEV